MTTRLALGAIAVCIAFAGLQSLEKPVAAQSTIARTSNGLLVEKIQVGGSCVVIVSHGAPGDGNVAAVPCN